MFCREHPLRASYVESSGKAAVDPELQSKLAEAIKLHARGIKLREAARQAKLPNHQGLMRAKAKMEEDGSWHVLVSMESDAAAVDSPVPVVAETPTTVAAVTETPLKDRLRRACTRHGDGVLHGKHGTIGMYREGVKWGTLQVAAGASAAVISRTLSDECGYLLSCSSWLQRRLLLWRSLSLRSLPLRGIR